MRVLMITWEFPPYIAGGLGMACYGLVKALASIGVEVDLILPTVEEVYFKIRRPEDADILPIEFIGERKGYFTVQTRENLIERLRVIGVLERPETYIPHSLNIDELVEVIFSQEILTEKRLVEAIKRYLGGEESLFKRASELALRAMRMSKLIEFDLVHVHDWLTYPAGLAVKSSRKKKLVAHIHATEFDRAGGPGDDRIHKIEYIGLEYADRVIAVSNYTARMIIDRYRIDPSKIRVVHNAYSVSPYAGGEKRRLFKDPLVLFLGRVTLQKGPDYFLEVAGRVISRYPNVRFVMAGSGDMFSRMLRSAAARRLKDRLLFSGFLNRDEVERILKATDIFVMPSVSEPFGIVPLEAMAFGAVTIISKQSGVSEVVKNAFKVDFWDIDKTVDIIVDLLSHPEKRREIAEAGRHEVLEIGWNEAALKLNEVYRELV